MQPYWKGLDRINMWVGNIILNAEISPKPRFETLTSSNHDLCRDLCRLCGYFSRVSCSLRKPIPHFLSPSLSLSLSLSLSPSDRKEIQGSFPLIAAVLAIDRSLVLHKLCSSSSFWWCCCTGSTLLYDGSMRLDAQLRKKKMCGERWALRTGCSKNNDRLL